MNIANAIGYLGDYFGLNKDVRVINFPITDNCNSRCTMCNIWKNDVKNEISPDEIRIVLAGPGFNTARHLGISGGEPTLRRDLVECAEAILESLPKLQTLSITTHGYHFNRWGRFLPLIAERAKRAGVRFSLNVSIDGYGSRHDLIRGISGAFVKASKTIDVAKAAGVPVQLQYTISEMNAYSMQLALDFAKSKSCEIVYRVATEIERLYNSDRSAVFIDMEQRSFVADFFSSPDLIAQTRSLSRKLYYRSMQAWLVGKAPYRSMPCYFKEQGLLLTSNLDVFPCSVTDRAATNDLRATNYVISQAQTRKARQETKEQHCESCIHDQSGAWSPKDILLFYYERSRLGRTLPKILKLTRNLLTASLYAPGAALHGSRRGKLGKLEHAIVIGAYGGEHVGDAAILGGVILRARENHGIRRFTILSLRPDRTRKWVASLSISDVSIDVVPSSMQSIHSTSGSADTLLYAGGPIMDIPVNLSFYLAAAVFCRAKGLQFIVEGVGLGPYRRKISKIFAGLLLRASDQITLRSRANLISLPFGAPQLEHNLDKDPAFDYLDYARKNSPELSIGTRDEFELAKLDEYIAGRSKVLFVNLRPLWDAYITPGDDSTAEEVDQATARTIAQIANTLPKEWALVFCPFNPDTYGFSDFSSFFKTIEKLKETRDCYVVEYEPGIPLMLRMLERSSHLLAMRFHACIFGLSSDLNVYGIDYQVGGSGKVANLFESFGNHKFTNVSKIDVDDINQWLGQ